MIARPNRLKPCLLLILANLLGACGQKGPLMIPTPPPIVTTHYPSTPPTPTSNMLSPKPSLEK